METKMLDAHIPLPLAERLDALALDLALPRDVIVTEAVTAWLDHEERRRIATLRTLAAANTIILVEHGEFDLVAVELTPAFHLGPVGGFRIFVEPFARLGACIEKAEAICLTHEMVFPPGGRFRPMSRYPALQAVEGRRPWNFFHQTYLFGKGSIEIRDLRVESWKRVGVPPWLGETRGHLLNGAGNRE